MTKKIGKEVAAAGTPKNGILMSRPKGRTEAETKSKARRKPMIISHLTDKVTVPAPKAKVKDWSAAKEPKKAGSDKAKPLAKKPKTKARSLSKKAKSISSQPNFEKGLDIQESARTKRIHEALEDHLFSIWKRAPEQERFSDVLWSIQEMSQVPTKDVVEKMISKIPKPDRSLLLAYFSEAFCDEEEKDSLRRELAAEWIADAFPAEGESFRPPLSWKAAYPVILNAYKSAPAGKIPESVANVLEALEPQLSTLDARGVAIAAGVPEAWTQEIWLAYRRENKSRKSYLENAEREADNIRREEKAAGLPKTAEECPAYLRKVFEQAKPETIANETGIALDRILPIWGGYEFRLFEESGISEAWQTEISLQARYASEARKAAVRKAEQERRSPATVSVDSDALPDAPLPSPASRMDVLIRRAKTLQAEANQNALRNRPFREIAPDLSIPKSFNPAGWIEEYIDTRKGLESEVAEIRRNYKFNLKNGCERAVTMAFMSDYWIRELDMVVKAATKEFGVSGEDNRLIAVCFEAIRRQSPIPRLREIAALELPTFEELVRLLDVCVKSELWDDEDVPGFDQVLLSRDNWHAKRSED